MFWNLMTELGGYFLGVQLAEMMENKADKMELEKQELELKIKMLQEQYEAMTKISS